MPKKTEKIESEVKEEVRPSIVEAPNAKVNKTAVQVFNKNDKFVREYTIAKHGSEFAELAKEYAGKIGGSYRFPIIL